MGGAITLDTLVSVEASGLVSAGLGEEMFTMDIATGTFFGIDAVGKTIWDRIQTPIAVHQLRDALVAEYQVTPEQCLADLLRFLEELKAQGLLAVPPGNQSV